MATTITTIYRHATFAELAEAYTRLREHYTEHGLPLPLWPEQWPETPDEIPHDHIGARVNTLLTVCSPRQTCSPRWDDLDQVRLQQTLRHIFRSAVGHKSASHVHTDNAGVTYLSS